MYPIIATVALLAQADPQTQNPPIQNPPAQTAPANPAVAISSPLTGTVSYRGKIMLPRGAVLDVELYDVSRGNDNPITIARRKMPLEYQVPAPFSLTFDTAQLKANTPYALEARIWVDNEVVFRTSQLVPVNAQNPNEPMSVTVAMIGSPTASMRAVEQMIARQNAAAKKPAAKPAARPTAKSTAARPRTSRTTASARRSSRSHNYGKGIVVPPTSATEAYGLGRKQPSRQSTAGASAAQAPDAAVSPVMGGQFIENGITSLYQNSASGSTISINELRTGGVYQMANARGVIDRGVLLSYGEDGFQYFPDGSLHHVSVALSNDAGGNPLGARKFIDGLPAIITEAESAGILRRMSALASAPTAGSGQTAVAPGVVAPIDRGFYGGGSYGFDPGVYPYGATYLPNGTAILADGTAILGGPIANGFYTGGFVGVNGSNGVYGFNGANALYGFNTNTSTFSQGGFNALNGNNQLGNNGNQIFARPGQGIGGAIIPQSPIQILPPAPALRPNTTPLRPIPQQSPITPPQRTIIQ